MFFHMVYKSGQIFLPFCHKSRAWQTDRRTDGQTEFSSLDRVCIPCSAVMNSLLMHVYREKVANLLYERNCERVHPLWWQETSKRIYSSISRPSSWSMLWSIVFFNYMIWHKCSYLLTDLGL